MEKLLEVLNVAEHIKDVTRHCYTKNGRHESVAEHSWMMTLMAFLMRDEFPEVDMDKVAFSDYLKILREEIRKDTCAKLGE